MPRKCVVCGLTQTNNLAVFTFPKSQHQKSTWVTAIQQVIPGFCAPQENGEPLSSRSGLCENHFLPDDIRKGKKKSLQRKAIPSLAVDQSLPTSSRKVLAVQFSVPGEENGDQAFLISDEEDTFRTASSSSSSSSLSSSSVRRDRKADLWEVNEGHTSAGTCLGLDFEDYLPGNDKSAYNDCSDGYEDQKLFSEGDVGRRALGKDLCLVCGKDNKSSRLTCILQLDAQAGGECTSLCLSRIVSRPKRELMCISRKICSRCTNLVQEVTHLEEDLKYKKQNIKNMYNATLQTHKDSAVVPSSFSQVSSPLSEEVVNSLSEVPDVNLDLQKGSELDKDGEMSDNTRKSSRRQASAKKYCCPQCKEVFSSLALWVHHLSKHQEMDESTLKVARQSSNKTKKLTKIGTHICEECGKKFVCKQTLLAHAAAHQKGSECTICGRYLTTKARLKVHMFKFHDIGEGKNKEVECTDCGKCFGTKAGLRYHRNVVHHTGTKYVCEHCNKMFYYHVPYKSHLLHAHGEKKIVCETCGEKFFTVSKLNTHINAVHRSAESWTCKECQTKFTTYTAYRHHRNVKHLKIQHACDYCNAQFRKKSSLVVHLWKHSVYLCQQCQESFSSAEELKTHMARSHGKVVMWKDKRKANPVLLPEKKESSNDDTLQEKPESQEHIQPSEHVASIVINDLLMTAESYDNSSLQPFSLANCEKLPEKQSYASDGDMKVKTLSIIDTAQELSEVEHMQFGTVETLEIKSSPDHIEMASGVSLINVQILGDMEISQTDTLGDLKSSMLADAADHLTHDGQMDNEDNMASHLRVEMHHLAGEDLAVDNDLEATNHTLEAEDHLEPPCHLKVDDLENSCHLESSELESSCHLETASHLESCCHLNHTSTPEPQGHLDSPDQLEVQNQLEKTSLPPPSHLEVGGHMASPRLRDVASLGTTNDNSNPASQLSGNTPITSDHLQIQHHIDATVHLDSANSHPSASQCSLPAMITQMDSQVDEDMASHISQEMHNMTQDVDAQMDEQVEENLGTQMEAEIDQIAEVDSQMVEQEEDHIVAQMDTEIVDQVGAHLATEDGPHLCKQVDPEMMEESMDKQTEKMEGVELEPFPVTLDGKGEVQYQYVMYISAQGDDCQPE
ncbi:uncharacterized protein [Penaeus vannamei]|uniref:uncharacterized protein n=1 Tax=Penaeus vannamei TaxID=6689 RepID=UPI00387F70E1